MKKLLRKYFYHYNVMASKFSTIPSSRDFSFYMDRVCDHYPKDNSAPKDLEYNPFCERSKMDYEYRKYLECKKMNETNCNRKECLEKNLRETETKTETENVKIEILEELKEKKEEHLENNKPKNEENKKEEKLFRKFLLKKNASLKW